MFVFKKWMLYIIMIVVMIFTTPDREAHERKIQNSWISSGTNPDVIQIAMDHPSLSYHDIYIFTYTKNNRRVLTFGAFGMVFKVGN